MKTFAALILCVNLTFAHAFWINLDDSKTHIIASLGWGHKLPVDESLDAVNAKIAVENFSVITPKNKEIKLPVSQGDAPNLGDSEIEIYRANLAPFKLVFSKSAPRGNYIFRARTKPTFYTQYIDKKGHAHFKPVPKSQVKDAQKIIASLRYQAFAKSYYSLGNAVQNAPALGDTLEIIPLSDMKNLKVGDEIELKVLFNGRELSVNMHDAPYITAYSSDFKDGSFALISYLENGRAKFEITRKGRWMIGVFTKQNVLPGDEFSQDASVSYNVATFSFDVR